MRLWIYFHTHGRNVDRDFMLKKNNKLLKYIDQNKENSEKEDWNNILTK